MIVATQHPASHVSRFFFRVLVALLTINLTTIAALIYIAYTFSAESLSKHTKDQVTQQVNILAEKFHAEFQVTLNRSLRNLLKAQILDDYLQGSVAERLVIRRRLERRFLQIQEDYSDFSSICFVESSGHVTVKIQEGHREPAHMLHSSNIKKPEQVHAMALFEKLKETPLLLSSGNMEWFMPPRKPEVIGPFLTSKEVPVLLAGLGKLDIDTGQFGGVVMIQMNLDRWLNELKDIQFLDSNSVWIVDFNNMVLLKPQISQNTFDPRPYLNGVANTATHLIETSNGFIVYHDLFIKSDTPILRIAITLPSDLLFHSLSHAIDFFSVVVDFYSLVILVSVILLAVLSYIIARYLARPVLDLAIAKNQLANAQRIARLGHWEWSVEKNIVHFSDNALAILVGTSDARKLDFKAFLQLVHPDDRASFKQVLEKVRQHGSPGSIEHRILMKEGENRIVHQEIDVIVGDKIQIIGTIQDISDRKLAEERIRQLAYLDSVTGLANRTLLNEMAERALKAASKEKHRVGVMFLDLDHFKRINDTFGHEAGDELLRQVAKRLMHCVRPTDTVTAALDLMTKDKAVARLGGDEFIVLLPELGHEDEITPIALRIQSTLTRPFDIGGKEILVTGSLGISIFPKHGQSVDDLLKHADAAMYQAKAKGRNRFELYSSAMDREIQQRLSVEMRLHQAIESEEFVLYYQPRVDMESGQIVAVEALIRWIDPK